MRKLLLFLFVLCISLSSYSMSKPVKVSAKYRVIQGNELVKLILRTTFPDNAIRIYHPAYCEILVDEVVGFYNGPIIPEYGWSGSPDPLPKEATIYGVGDLDGTGILKLNFHYVSSYPPVQMCSMTVNSLWSQQRYDYHMIGNSWEFDVSSCEDIYSGPKTEEYFFDFEIF